MITFGFLKKDQLEIRGGSESLNPSSLLHMVCGLWPIAEMDQGPRPPESHLGFWTTCLHTKGEVGVRPQLCLSLPMTSKPFLRPPLKRLTFMVCTLPLPNLPCPLTAFSEWKGKVLS